jgi:hypothetical protein
MSLFPSWLFRYLAARIPGGEVCVSESMERAHETMHGGHHPAPDQWARRIAVLISALAATLALTDLGAKSSQNAYLTHHIAVSDQWAFYQAKNLRSVVRDSEATMLESLPNTDPAIQARVQAAREYSARMRDDPKGGEGMKQMAVKARAEEAERDEAFHRYHGYEYAVGALEISIVLASVAVVTRIAAFAVTAGGIGVVAAAVGLAVALHIL